MQRVPSDMTRFPDYEDYLLHQLIYSLIQRTMFKDLPAFIGLVFFIAVLIIGAGLTYGG